MMRYDQDLLKSPYLQIKIILNELRVLKNKGT